QSRQRLVGLHRHRGLLPHHHRALGYLRELRGTEGGIRPMSTASVLYDVPGPVTKRRQRILSAIVGLIILGILAAGIYAMYLNDIFNDRWLVLVDPPRGQTATN